MPTAIAVEKVPEMLGVVPVCGRDAALLPQFVRLWRGACGAAPVVAAVDMDDPVDEAALDGIPEVGCAWQGAYRAAAVLESMVGAALDFPDARWVAKVDVDVAVLDMGWFADAREGSVLIGLQNGIGAGMLGMAFALRRDVLMEIHAAGECRTQGPETGPILGAVRRRHVNDVWLWPHRPRAGGRFAAMTDPGKAGVYRELFSLVHCGVFPRDRAARLIGAF